MKLKNYQMNVINDLRQFLAFLIEKQDIREAYSCVWNKKGIQIGEKGMPPYHMVLKGVPHVCIKVPTGGGKTLIAAGSIKPIFEAMPNIHPKAVVWLVPSDAILTQTAACLRSADHLYRRKINADFGNHVEVYMKEELLYGQNFNPSKVDENLSIFVLSYDSFRTNKKEGRKAYQQNGYLEAFRDYKTNYDLLLDNTDETALIQVIRKLNPVVIVDESHHATSKLSVEMLENFNPSFVLDLTATPREGSNIISFVSAKQLKKEEMVKLPVIVYNRRSQSDVFDSAISLRQRLEGEACKEEIITKNYIRPIVLFQAESKSGKDSTTYEKIKQALLERGIPKEQIAIKTADKDEIRNQDLLSRECPVRYVITVNALKEGWDCSFAYVLATVANRTSVVDVEQILGRILRMPNVRANKSTVLNLSYVVTSSSNFLSTCEKIVEGLNAAGFSSKDYRAQDDTDRLDSGYAHNNEIQMQIDDLEGDLRYSSIEEDVDSKSQENQFQDFLPYKTGGTDSTSLKNETDVLDMVRTAELQNTAYWEAVDKEDSAVFEGIPDEVRVKMKTYSMRDEFVKEASELIIPQFVIETVPTLFSDHEVALLEKENLYKGFTLKDKDTQIDFNAIEVEIARIDVEDSNDGKPKAFQIKGYDNIHMKEWIDSQPSEAKRRICKDMICKKISRNNAINDSELEEYVGHIMDNMTEDQLTDLEQSYYPYMIAIEKKVNMLLGEYASDRFYKLLEQEHIICAPMYQLPQNIAPSQTISSIPKSLYSEEEDFDNDYEKKVIWELSALDNIKWWHRNIARKGFAINGAVTAYPDFMVMTNSGKILLIETKGDQLKNDESKIKAKIGVKWAAKASMRSRIYKYFMVFQTKNPDYEGAYSYDSFMEIVREL